MDVLAYKIIEMALREMTPRSKLYRIVQAEMKRRGHWKNKHRGDPRKGYQAMREKHKGVNNV